MLRADWSAQVTCSMAVEAVSGRVLSKVIWMELCGRREGGRRKRRNTSSSSSHHRSTADETQTLVIEQMFLIPNDLQ